MAPDATGSGEPSATGSTTIVVDVGGTTMRIGHYNPRTAALSGVRRVPVRARLTDVAEPTAGLQGRVVNQIVDEVHRYRAAHPLPPGAALGVAFAGPVADGGVVTAAPTVWGRKGDPLPLARLLEVRLGTEVFVVNDLTASVWRYVDRVPEPFCLITVSSGIGNKVYHAGRVMLDADGFGGELGHWTCDPSPDALVCDCGEPGHLGALASGRGSVAAASRLREREPALFAGSVLARHPSATAGIDAESLARACVAGDEFATAAVRSGVAHLASAVTALATAAGIRRFVVIGGFALGIGARYVDLLTEELQRRGCFGLSSDEIRRLAVLGESDDDHALIGVGRLVSGIGGERSFAC